MSSHLLASVLAAVANTLGAPQPTGIVYGPAPQWVHESPLTGSPSGAAAGTAADALLFDEQLRLTPAGDETFINLRYRINSPAGLAEAGSLNPVWDPSTTTLTIHRVQIRRGGRTIDLIAEGNKFSVLRREKNLEAAVIDGSLTASLQPEGLQVGDIIDFSFTTRRREPALEGRSEATALIAHVGTIKSLKVAASWPLGHVVKVWSTDDIGPLTVRDSPGWRTVTYEKSEAQSVEPPAGAPLRDQLHGLIIFGGFSDWSELSRAAYGQYVAAATVKGSSLARELETLRSQSSNPKVRALAALQLVEDKVRYLYVGLDAGGFIPASADATWSRRFGDCKGKVVLLLALLRGLGIDAEPMLVSTTAGDGLDRRPPQLSAFDHVVLRAQIGGKFYWMDPTRLGDVDLDLLKPPNLLWALPLRPSGGTLEPLIPDPLLLPTVDRRLELDLRSGLQKPSPAHMEVTLRGDGAVAFNILFKEAGPQDGDRAVRNVFQNLVNWINVDKVGFAFDPATAVAHLSMDGTGTPPVTGSGSEEKWWVDLSGLGWDADFRRDTTFHATAPYSVAFPSFERSTIEARLPPGGGFELGNAGPLAETLAGRRFDRSGSISADRMTVVASVQALAPEFPAAEAAAAQRALHELSLHDVVLQRKAPEDKASSPAAPPRDAAAEPPESLARREFAAKRFVEANAAFTRAIAADPNSAKLHYDLGASRLALGETELAKADFNTALSLNPKDAFALLGLGSLELLDQHWAQADQKFRMAVEFAPDQHQMTLNVGRAYFNAKRYPQAAVVFEAWAEAEPVPDQRAYGFNEACWSRAISGSDLPKALADCDDAIKARPTFANAFDSRGFVRLRTDENERAVQDYDRALKLRATSASSLYGRGLARRRAGQIAAGDADIKAALDLQPDIAKQFASWGVFKLPSEMN